MATFHLDTKEFDRTLREYLKVSKRDLATALNTKGFYIARRAVRETPKAKVDTSAAAKQIMAKAINKARRRSGLKGLFGGLMDAAIKKMIASRRRSVGFLKSGWLPAIKRLEPLAERRGAPGMGPKPRQFGKDFGYATPAREGWKPAVVIANTIGQSEKQEHGEALQKHGGPALQRAFNAETASMREYLERKLRAAAKRVGIKTN